MSVLARGNNQSSENTTTEMDRRNFIKIRLVQHLFLDLLVETEKRLKNHLLQKARNMILRKNIAGR